MTLVLRPRTSRSRSRSASDAPADPLRAGASDVAPPSSPVGGGGRRGRRGSWPAHRRIAAVVGLCYFVATWIIFRDVVTAIPAVMRGESVIVGDELVPFFNPTSQLFDQAKGEFSELTNGFEFRVRYSFLTTWLRHYQVLPFAILLVLPAVVLGAYLTTSWFVSRVFRSLSPTTVYLATAFPTALIYMIMVYAKITHFYTLVLGLWLMTVSAYTMLYALIFQRDKWLRTMVLSCAVTLLNPAVHYLILFALFLTLTVTTLLLGELAKWLREGGLGRAARSCRFRRVVGVVVEPRRLARLGSWLRRNAGTTTGRCVLAMTALVVVAMLPYALFVKFVALRGVENLSETVPGDYYFIRDASVSLVHILSWDLAGIMDKIRFGDYLAKVPRVPNALYMLLALAPIVVRPIRRGLFRRRPHRQLLGVIYVNVAFAIWATVGYANPSWFPTFHRSLAATTRALYATGTPVGDLALGVSSTVVQVLRFPHRFQLILFMIAPMLMSLPVAWAIDRLHGRWVEREASGTHRRGGVVTRVALAVAVGTIFLGPFFSNANYREVYASGNFGHFATAYPVDDLREVKDALLELPEGKTVVLPPTETAKLVIDPNGVPHKFIDKFYIYFLDEPSFYYGLTGDSENKFEFFLMLRGMYYQQDWWVNVARDIGVDYIILNKQVDDNRGVGAEYLPRIEEYLREQLEAVPDHLEAAFENDSFVLYRLTDVAPADRETLLFDTSWSDYLDTVFARLDLSDCYDFEYVTNYEGTPDDGSSVKLLATDPTSAAIDLWAIDHDEHFFVPSSRIFAFNPDVISSSYYLSPMFRLFLFFSDTKWNRTEMITPGIFGTLRGSFIGTPRPTRFTVPTEVHESGEYRVLVRAAATANDVGVSSRSLGFDERFELRSPPDALQLFDADTIYESDRVPVATAAMSVEQLEQRVPAELVPVNLRYVYHDLGVVEAPAGPHTFVFDKSDANPMLVEGVLLVPADVYERLVEPAAGLPDHVDLVESASGLDCSHEYDVRAGARDGSVAGVENGPHADLTDEELLELIGVDDLAPPSPDGLGGRWIHLIVSGMILAACFAVIRWRARTSVVEDDVDDVEVGDEEVDRPEPWPS